MRLKFTRTILTTLCLFGCLVLFVSYEDGPASNGNAWIGAPGESGVTCGTCHSNPGAFGFVNIDITMHTMGGVEATNYVPGNTYTVTVIVNPEVGAPAGYGFQAVALDVANNNAGTFTSESDIISIRTLNERLYAEHNMPSPSRTFALRWEAPETDIGDVTFYASGNTVNGDGTTAGDSGIGTAPAKLTVGSNTSLAVELLTFEAEQSFNSVLLKWITQTESNSDYFALEHAPQGIDFKEIATIPAVGFSTDIQAYSEYHITPNNGLNYYRLKQVDTDGTFKYSDIIVFEMNKKDRPTLEAIPNLIANNTSIFFHNNMGYTFRSEVRVHAMSGQLVSTYPFEILQGENRLELDLSDLESGYYTISLKETSGAIRIFKN